VTDDAKLAEKLIATLSDLIVTPSRFLPGRTTEIRS
jgi:hypothetical protein